MKTKLIQKIKEEFFEKFTYKDGDEYGGFTNWNLNVEAEPEKVWNFIEKAISQSKEEMVEEVKKLKLPDTYIETGKAYNLAIKHVISLLEDLNKK